MLAYVRARNGDLGKLRDLWLDLGAMLDLLREPADVDVPSLLYGDRRMFKDLDERLPTLSPDRDVVDPPSTTLYITTTLLSGESSRFTDALGTLVQDNDKRGLFTFNESDLARDDIEGALALAARSTASFPGAFEPSFIPFDTGTAAAGEIPARPAMKDFANITRSHWVADGGLLDNQPLDVLLERIFDRRARRPVRRILLYVVPTAGPSADAAKATPGADLATPYGLLAGLMADLSAATSQSISADLRGIVAHNDRTEARSNLRLQLAATAARLAPQRLLTASLLKDYIEQEREDQARTLTTAMLKVLTTWPTQTAGAPFGIPPGWLPPLRENGGAERQIVRAIGAVLEGRWNPVEGDPPKTSDPALPQDDPQFARYGQTAFDEAKSMVLSVLLDGYDAAAASDRTELSDAVAVVHKHSPKPARPRPEQLAESTCIGLAQQANGAGPAPSLTDAATALATAWSNQTGAGAEAWAGLATALKEVGPLLTRLATSSGGALSTYVEYLGLDQAAIETGHLSAALFDLAVSERALLPVGIEPYQPVELVQLSADTRSLLAPKLSTAGGKLTGLQFHHFGAFYKASWRANDWMWGRLDSAGWLVHALLDPRRLRLRTEDVAAGDRADWLIEKLESFGPVPLADGPDRPDGPPTRAGVKAELSFLDPPDLDPPGLDKPELKTPSSLPRTALWLATAWQEEIVDEELPVLAGVVLGEPGREPDRSPRATQSWAREVLDAVSASRSGGGRPDLTALLQTCPVPTETFATDMGSPLMVRTLAKAAATTTAVINSTQQIPGAVRPAVKTAHTIALGGYRATVATKASARILAAAGLMLLAIGIGAAVQSAAVFGVGGLLLVGLGGYLLAFGAWQTSGRLFAALVAVTLTGAVASLATPVVRNWLFGSSPTDPGLVGRHLHWFAESWWHPLLPIVLLVVLLAVVGATSGRLRRKAV
jgi:patatin-related protein